MLGQAQLLALVQVGRAWQGEHEQRGRAGPAQAEPGVRLGVRRPDPAQPARGGREAEPRRVTDDVVVAQHPRRRCPHRGRAVDRRGEDLALGPGLPRRHAVVEVERLVQLVGAGVTGQSGVGRHPRLGHEHAVPVVGVDDLPPFAVDLVDLLAVPHRRLVGVRDLGRAAHGAVVVPVGQARLLDHGVGHVDAESVDPAVQPEPERGCELLVHVGGVPAHVRLGGVEQVQVPLARGAVRLRHPGPGGSTEHRAPVVGRLRPVVPATVAEVVPGALGAARGCRQGRLEPPVLAAGVVGDDVDDHPQSQVVGPADEPVGVVEGAEDGLDVAVVRHVVARVVLRGRVERGQPHRVDPQGGQRGQAGRDARQVADPVAVGVRE